MSTEENLGFYVQIKIRRNESCQFNNNIDLFQPPYALIGSLNGVHVFGESHGVTLCTTRTQNASLTWKTYHDR